MQTHNHVIRKAAMRSIKKFFQEKIEEKTYTKLTKTEMDQKLDLIIGLGKEKNKLMRYKLLPWVCLHRYGKEDTYLIEIKAEMEAGVGRGDVAEDSLENDF